MAQETENTKPTEEEIQEETEKEFGKALDLDEEEVVEEVDEASEIEAELAKTKDQLARLSADFDNFRKRQLKEREELYKYAAQDLLEKILPILDNFDHAAAAVDKATEEGKKMSEGFLMIKKQLETTLSEEGLKEIPAMGEIYDPNLHEAMMNVEATEEQKDDEIVLVLRKGYTYKDKVIRVSLVNVAKK